ncbi:MAG TPA: SIMPL domain-containing protein [Candidatus Baltobacteraceae bacterium]|nr:SIMPL domain-containing protein [Candidatus Baltobacteraceae bacterium]
MFRTIFAPLFAAAISLYAPQVTGAPSYAGNTIPDGITVRGTGNATVMADQATLTLRLFGRNNTAAITESTIAPIVDALVRAGVARSDITTPEYLTGSAQTANATISAVIHHPTVALIQSGAGALAAAFPPNGSIFVSNGDVRLSAADCSSTRAAAQAQAIRQARANAESIARGLNVRVGPVLAVDYQSNAFDQNGGCFFNYSIGPFPNAMFTTPDDYLRVRVSSFVTVRYAIK